MNSVNSAVNKPQAFRLALIAGAFRDLAIYNGGTGWKRKALTEREYLARKQRNKVAKMSRKQNRKGA